MLDVEAGMAVVKCYAQDHGVGVTLVLPVYQILHTVYIQ